MKRLFMSLLLLFVSAVLLQSLASDPRSRVLHPKGAQPLPTAAEFEKADPPAYKQAGIGMQERISRIRTLSRKALLSKEEARLSVAFLSDAELQNHLFETLSAGDSGPFDVDQERERMDMVGLLNLIVKQRAIEGRQSVIDRAVARVTSLDFRTIKDLRQKQSIFGDTVEIIQILKNSDLEAYEAVKSSITQQEQKALTRALLVAGEGRSPR